MRPRTPTKRDVGRSANHSLSQSSEERDGHDERRFRFAKNNQVGGSELPPTYVTEFSLLRELLGATGTFTTAIPALAVPGRWTAFTTTGGRSALSAFTTTLASLTTRRTTAATAALATTRRRPLWQQLFGGQLAIAIAIERLEHSRGIGDFRSGQLPILVGIQNSCDRDKLHGLFPAHAPRSSGRPALSAFATALPTFAPAPLPAFASARRWPTFTRLGSALPPPRRRTIPFTGPLSHRHAESHHDESSSQCGQPVSFLHDHVLERRLADTRARMSQGVYPTLLKHPVRAEVSKKAKRLCQAGR